MQLPKKTTRNIIEPLAAAYVVPFAPELIDYIIKRHKLTTYRFGKKYDYLCVGDEVTIQNSATGESVCKARIATKSLRDFKSLPIDTPGHEPYRDKEHQRSVFSGYYAYLGREIKDDDTFIIFDFELVDSPNLDTE